MPSAPPNAKHLRQPDPQIGDYGGCLRCRGRTAIAAASILLALAFSGCESSDQMAGIDRYLLGEAQNAEQRGDYVAASQRYGTLYESNRDQPKVLEAMARNMRRSGQFEPARRILEEALARLGPLPQLLLEKGKDEIALGRADLAVQTLQVAVQGAPTEWEPASTLAIAYDRTSQYDAAAAQYKIAIGLYPENADIINNYALSRALAGDLDEARSLLNKAVKMPAASQRTRENLALLEALRNQPPPRAGTIGIAPPALNQPPEIK
ncbi:MAG: tetratricopeptide repeat protein [Rhodospirillaceae bacterium]